MVKLKNSAILGNFEATLGHFEAILGTFLAIFRPPGLLQVKLAFLGVGGLSGLQILLRPHLGNLGIKG